ncbi:unnamed protein product [Alopecurus aequalis]
MKLHVRVFLFASIAVALIMSRGAAAGTHSIPAHYVLQGNIEDDAGFMEREEEAAYPQRRVLYDQEYITYNGVQANNAACNGPCPGRGQPYTGSDCQAIFGCRGR